MKRTPQAFLATLVSAPLLLVACGSSSDTSSAGSTTPSAGSISTASNPPAATATTIGIDNFAFTPDNATTAVGTTITWTNDQKFVHTVTADDGSFDSGDMAAGATFEQTFDATGTFTYHCSSHSNMTGTITVQ